MSNFSILRKAYDRIPIEIIAAIEEDRTIGFGVNQIIHHGLLEVEKRGYRSRRAHELQHNTQS